MREDALELLKSPIAGTEGDRTVGTILVRLILIRCCEATVVRIDTYTSLASAEPATATTMRDGRFD